MRKSKASLCLNTERGGIRRDMCILLSILAVVFFVWWVGWQWIDKNIIFEDNAETFEARGQFGDKFGAINALFAGFAFAGIIFTILLQSREIRQTKKMLEEQLKESNRQRFDGTFFQLLNLHNDITSKLTDLQNHGRQSFKTFHDRLISSDIDFPSFCALNKVSREEIRTIKDARAIPVELKQKLEASDISNLETALDRGTSCCENFLDDNIGMHEEKIRIAYTKSAQIHIDNYSHYFRNLYHTLLFVKESNLIEADEKRRYAKILRSQLSDSELITLFYNSLTEIRLPGREQMELGYPKMGKLLHEFDILQNLSPRTIIHPSHKEIFERNNGRGH
ncbi:putative phage abortive infection protein [Metapseudomonas otitidis]|uniref:putative phage abortive infection protein n=1 Tax=Metapseudomonas otitidis TaxID=319939 RepID=UPI0013F682E2|nr:putative phage abortive infection protein [Pseudomonas otitidis]